MGIDGLREGFHTREKSRVFQQSLLSSLKIGVDSEERSQKKVCYRARNESEGWTWRNGEKCEELQLVYLLP